MMLRGFKVYWACCFKNPYLKSLKIIIHYTNWNEAHCIKINFCLKNNTYFLGLFGSLFLLFLLASSLLFSTLELFSLSACLLAFFEEPPPRPLTFHLNISVLENHPWKWEKKVRGLERTEKMSQQNFSKINHRYNVFEKWIVGGSRNFLLTKN